MATITPRKRAGGLRYTAQIRIRRKGGIVHTESKTFSKRSLATAWAKAREAELELPGALDVQPVQQVLVGSVLSWYRNFCGAETGSSRYGQILILEKSVLADADALKLSVDEVVTYGELLKRKGLSPSTIYQYLIWLRLAFNAYRTVKRLEVSTQAVEDAMAVMRQVGMISKSKRRERRPSLDELDKALGFLSGRDARSDLPMVDVVLFAIFSTRRQGEIFSIRWPDLDRDNHRVLVRDMKHPREKRDTWVYLPEEAMSIIDRQPVIDGDDRIFPFNARSAGSAFTRTIRLLGIDDLRFHDLRHEGISWLFEQGFDIPRVATISGHMSWASLQRYTHLQGREPYDKYDGWGWRPCVSEQACQ